MTAKDYPITQGYGYDPNYQGNAQHWHTGIDYGAPEGTPIVVNGVKIGITGHTGKVYDQNGQNTVNAAHVHLGRYFNGETNPGSGGWDIPNPYVTDIGYDDTNGNFVGLLDTEGVRWVYLHMQEKSTNVKVGDYLNNLPKFEGEEDMPNNGDITNYVRAAMGKDSNYEPTDADKAPYDGWDHKKWAYFFSGAAPLVNDGDTDNAFLATDGRRATDQEKAGLRDKSHKTLLYEVLPKTTVLRESATTKYKKLDEPVFVEDK